eukprot:Skav210793  [mRNA]  locus=scaffold275:183012:187893:+ [translate_table: standard]
MNQQIRYPSPGVPHTFCTLASKEPKKELAAAGDAGAIVALAGPGTALQRPAPKVIPGLPNARPASKASGQWSWGGSTGGVAFVPPKRPALSAVQAQAGATAATLLVRLAMSRLLGRATKLYLPRGRENDF